MRGDPCGVAGAGRRGPPLRFRIEGLKDDASADLLKAAVRPFLSEEAGLALDARTGLMIVCPAGGTSVEAITRTVAVAGMRAELMRDDVSPIEAEHPVLPSEPLVFRVIGLNGEDQAEALSSEVAPVVGGAEHLFFDVSKGVMTAAPMAAVSAAAITAAVARTGMRATASVNGRGSMPHRLFRVHGLAGKDGVALLEHALGPVVGGRHALAFDVGRGAMTVVGGFEATPPEAIREAVRLTGMDAEFWKGGGAESARNAACPLGARSGLPRTVFRNDEMATQTPIATDALEERGRRLRMALTATTAACLGLGVTLHAWLGGGLKAALGAEEAAGGTPLLAVLAYGGAIAGAVCHVATGAWVAARRLRPDGTLPLMLAVIGIASMGEWFAAAAISLSFTLGLQTRNPVWVQRAPSLLSPREQVE